MSKLFLFICCGLASLTLYKTYFIEFWVFFGFAAVTAIIAIIFIAMASVYRDVASLQYMQTNRQIDLNNSSTESESKSIMETDFFPHPFKDEELELIDGVRDGLYIPSLEFLKTRSRNQNIIFAGFTEEMCILMARRLINYLNRREVPSWEVLITNEKNVL